MSPMLKNAVLGLVALALPAAFVATSLSAAATRLEENDGAATGVPLAAAANEDYCTPALKAILRRVAGSCGLLSESGGRGCRPMEARKVAALSDADFNALFLPLADRAHILQFDPDQVELDEDAQREVEEAWADQRGASFFFVVARASRDGGTDYNEELSRKRAQAVLAHLEAKFRDPSLKKEVGLLWLGESFAQLDEDFCRWQRSRSGECTAKDVNRSAFVAWIDCAI
jgi:hypothetical protein